MSFFLVRLESGLDGKMVDVPIPDYGPYEKGPEAAKFAKQLSEQLGHACQILSLSAHLLDLGADLLGTGRDLLGRGTVLLRHASCGHRAAR